MMCMYGVEPECGDGYPLQSLSPCIVPVLLGQLLQRFNKLCIAQNDLAKVVCKTKEFLHFMPAAYVTANFPRTFSSINYFVTFSL